MEKERREKEEKTTRMSESKQIQDGASQ